MLRYTDGKDWYDCMKCMGFLLTVTADEKMAVLEVLPTDTFTVDRNGVVVDIQPTVKVTILETENYYEERSGTWEHFFDLESDDSPITLNVSVSGRQIKRIFQFS